MKLNLALNAVIILMILMSFSSLLSYVFATVFLLLNLLNTKSLHRLWILSGLQSLFVIHHSSEIGLLCIAASNVLYYYNLNLVKTYQNNTTDMVNKRLYILIMIQCVVITILAVISSGVNITIGITAALTALFVVVGLFWLLLIKKAAKHD